MEDLSTFRKALDAIDAQLIELLGRRFDICRQVANYKRLNQVPMMQPERIQEVQRRNAELAKTHALNPEFVRDLYALIIAEACRLEDQIIDADPQSR